MMSVSQSRAYIPPWELAARRRAQEEEEADDEYDSESDEEAQVEEAIRRSIDDQRRITRPPLQSATPIEVAQVVPIRNQLNLIPTAQPLQQDFHYSSSGVYTPPWVAAAERRRLEEQRDSHQEQLSISDSDSESSESDDNVRPQQRRIAPLVLNTPRRERITLQSTENLDANGGWTPPWVLAARRRALEEAEDLDSDDEDDIDFRVMNQRIANKNLNVKNLSKGWEAGEENLPGVRIVANKGHQISDDIHQICETCIEEEEKERKRNAPVKNAFAEEVHVDSRVRETLPSANRFEEALDVYEEIADIAEVVSGSEGTHLGDLASALFNL